MSRCHRQQQRTDRRACGLVHYTSIKPTCLLMAVEGELQMTFKPEGVTAGMRGGQSSPAGMWMVMPLLTFCMISLFSPAFSSTMPNSIWGRQQMVSNSHSRLLDRATEMSDKTGAGSSPACGARASASRRALLGICQMRRARGSTWQSDDRARVAAEWRKQRSQDGSRNRSVGWALGT